MCDGVDVLGQLSLFRELARDVRLCCVHPEMAAVRKVEAIMHLVNEVLPAPPGSPARPGYVEPGTGPEGVAGLLAARLAGHPQMATAVVTEYAGEGVTVKTDRDGWLDLDDGGPGLFGETERLRLGVPCGTRCYWREGWMVTASGVVAARVRLLAVPARLPADVAARLGGAAAFGSLVAVHDPHRRAREARVSGAAVESTAAVVLGQARAACALGWEQVTAEFTMHLARAAAKVVA